MAHVRFKSLRTKFLALLALGGSLVAAAGVWITYTTTVGHFEAQLIKQSKLLAASLNHSAMVADTSMQVQHVVDQLTRLPEINYIVVTTLEPAEIMASSNRDWRGMKLDQLPDRHLGEQLLEIGARGDFGHHFDNEANTLVLNVPLDPQMTMMQMGTMPEHGMAQGGATMPEHGMAPERGPRHDIEPTTAREGLPYRGVIMLVVDSKEASAASSQILWLLCIALVAAVLIMMSIAYVIVNRQILDRLMVIRDAMTKRESSSAAIPIPVAANDEISDLGRAFNNMIERIDVETKRREDAEHVLHERVDDLEEAQRKLEMQGTDLVRLADDLLIARDEARAADRAKSEFLAAMSHELRTPLNAVIGFSEIIRDETFGPVESTKYRDYANDIHESGQHLLGLINDILDLSKIESGTEELHEDKIVVPEFIDSVLKLVEQRAEQGAIKLQLEFADQLPALRADERKLKQILVNLLSNAIKFSNSGGEVALWIWCRSDSGHVFQIIDTGIGIAPEDIPKALSRFGQVDGDLNRQYQGTGLGLPLTKALIELHGGTLDLHSQVGVGTIVTVRFPAERIVESPRDFEPIDATAKMVG